MIMLIDKTKYCSKLNQKVYDEMISRIDFTELECDCGKKGTLVKIGNYTRYYKTSSKRIKIKIQRVKCKHCGKTHAILVENIVPCSMLSPDIHLEMIKSYYSKKLNEFLLKYPTIERSNIIYTVHNYEKKWLDLLKRIIEKSHVKELILYCLNNFHLQFMQMKKNLILLLLV